jgi:hypothetical protein
MRNAMDWCVSVAAPEWPHQTPYARYASTSCDFAAQFRKATCYSGILDEVRVESNGLNDEPVGRISRFLC